MRNHRLLLGIVMGCVFAGLAAAKSMLYESALEAYRDKDYQTALDRFMDVSIAEPENVEAQQYIQKIGKELLSGRGGSAAMARGALSAESAGPKQEISSKGAAALLKSAARAADREHWFLASDELSRLNASGCADLQLLGKAGTLQREVDANLEKTLKSPKGAESGFLQRGWEAYKNGNFSTAVESWKAYLMLAPDDEEMAQMLKRAGTADNSRLRQLRAESMVVEGEKSFRAGRYAEARQNWEEALALSPNDDMLKRKLSTLEGVERASNQVNAGDYNEALGTLTDVLTLEPQNYMAISLLKLLEQQVGKNPSLNMRIGEEPKTRVVQARTDVPRETRPVPASTVTAAEAAKEPPRAEPPRETSRPRVIGDRVQAIAHYNRGLVFYAENKIDMAIQEWRKSLEFDPSFQKSQRAIERAQAESQPR